MPDRDTEQKSGRVKIASCLNSADRLRGNIGLGVVFGIIFIVMAFAKAEDEIGLGWVVYVIAAALFFWLSFNRYTWFDKARGIVEVHDVMFHVVPYKRRVLAVEDIAMLELQKIRDSDGDAHYSAWLAYAKTGDDGLAAVDKLKIMQWSHTDRANSLKHAESVAKTLGVRIDKSKAVGRSAE